MLLTGFGNYHQSEAVAGALPQNQNSPQKCPLNLVAEQLSGSAFTRERHLNLRSWLYRKTPSVVHGDYQLYDNGFPLKSAGLQSPNPLRWSPLPAPVQSLDFIDGLFHVASTSQLSTWIYQCNKSMTERYMSNSDGEMLFVPYEGEITLFTEFGRLSIAAGQIAIIPRGVVFKVELNTPRACGYLCENAGQPLKLPTLGLIGANGLANPRHFVYPNASYEEGNHPVSLFCKYQGRLWVSQRPATPLNVLAWHGNYAPCSYDLSLFNTINTVSFDHPDPSIFTVLSSESAVPGIANLDFVIFPPRWMVAENTFRPPYFHRNIMSELMGLITGQYDAKKEGFTPGGISIHNNMVPHGPDTETYHTTVNEELTPGRYDNTLAFMFETNEVWQVSEAAMAHASRQQDYSACWQGLGLTV
ncbi:homogentisate 1,2-dioxygenase [Legionella sp. CNM-4043-24]|uniref:homogentisate 1,2-dioxygenase n=1 Tax=Legionella sp. CNM-4043-24 TaxID=3421646 RepID=UPI00403B2388